MKIGDIVRIYKINRWGGRILTDKAGVLISRTVLAYERKNCYWNVMINGRIQKMKEESLKRIEK
jgi:hypothetical protein